ncbi:transferase [Aureococcus anophagefferens]|nr:transferase [Aureococcus anophagefferens]
MKHLPLLLLALLARAAAVDDEQPTQPTCQSALGVSCTTALNATLAAVRPSCAAALEDYAENFESTANQLARYASADFLTFIALYVEFALDPVKNIQTLLFEMQGHVDDLGDPAACGTIAGFRYFVLDGAGVAVIVAACLLVALALTATAADVVAAAPAPGDGYAALNGGDAPARATPAWLACFSLRRTWGEWLAGRGGPLACLDGVRCLSMLYVVYGHSILWPTQAPGYTNMYEAVVPHDGKGYMATVRGQVLNAAEFSVDTFFWLSGFLGAFVASKVAARATTCTWIPRAYLQRYLRLTPSYAFIVLLWWKVLRVYGSGPVWAQQRGEYRDCAKTFWTNMLYVNNLVPFHGTEDACYGVAWYLPNDMQFFLLLPGFVSLKLKSAAAAYAVLGALALASVAYAWWAAYAFDLSFATFDGGDYFPDYYVRPWTRIPPYLVGVATAFYYADAAKDKAREPPSARVAYGSLAAGLAVAAALVFGSYPFYQDAPGPAKWKNHLYLALAKPAWACALSLLALPCFFGRGAFVGGILSLPVFAPLAKLTFAAYLIHPAVLDVLYKSSTDARVVFTEVGWYVAFLGVSAIVLLCSLVVHLFVEQPLVNLEKHVLRGEPRPPRPAPAPEARAGADVVYSGPARSPPRRGSRRRAGRDVLELGCGNGFAALVAAASGARRVLATDVSPRALDLTRRAAAEQRLAVDVAAFDARGPEPLPAGFDLLVARAGKELVAADVLYDAPLALAVADRVVEPRARGMDVVVGGSPDREGRDAFVAALSAKLPGAAFEPAYDVGHEDLKWKRKRVEVLHLLEGGGVSSG